MTTHVLLIGGRSGSGKTQAASELHALLAREDVRHAVIEGDYLDLAHPAPWEHHLAERNLAAVWANYRELGYERLIYSNTIAPLQAAELAAAMGDDPVVTAVLLSASNDTTYARLAGRESGAELQEHLRRSETRFREPWVVPPRGRGSAAGGQYGHSAGRLGGGGGHGPRRMSLAEVRG